MTVERAKLILKDAITLFTQADNKAALAKAVEECNALPEEQRQMGKMQKLIPLVTGMVGPKLVENGLPNARRPASRTFRRAAARDARRARRWVTWAIRSWSGSCRFRASRARTRPSARRSQF